MSPEAPRVLIIEDNETLLMGLELNLKAEGFEVLTTKDGAMGLRLSLEEHPDLIILDLMLPGLNGFEILSQLRRRERRLPVIILSARGEEQDKLEGFGLGADDYVTKPFSLKELIARVHARLRLTGAPGVEVNLIRFSTFDVDFDSRRIYRAGEEIKLTAREYDLLEYLIHRPGRVHSRERLLLSIWGYDYEGTERTVDNFIRSLRVKLEDDAANPRHLVTVRGTGYRFEN